MDVLDTQKLVKESQQLGQKMVADIIKRHKDAGQYTTGKTSGMLHIVPTANGYQLVGWTYTGTYEEGRKPSGWGNGGSGTGFTDSLLEWAKAKGLTFKTPKDAQSWAFCVMRKICREGTRRYKDAQSGNRTDILTTPIADMQKALKRAASGFYAEEIIRTLFRIDLQQE